MSRLYTQPSYTAYQDLINKSGQGYLSETYPSGPHIGALTLTLQTVFYALVGVKAGVPITGAFTNVGTTQTVTSCWMALYDTSNGRQALSADTPALVGTAGTRSVAFTSAYTPTADGAMYVAILCVGGTAPTIARATNAFASGFNAVSGVVRTGTQTGQSSMPSTASITGTATLPYLGTY